MTLIKIEKLIKNIEKCQQIILSEQSVIKNKIDKLNDLLIAATLPPIELYQHQILQLKGACEFIGYTTNLNIDPTPTPAPTHKKSGANNTIKVLLYWISKGEYGLTISGHVPYIIQEMLDGKYHSKPSGKPGGIVLKGRSFTDNGINALFKWLAKHDIKWKYMGLDTIFNSKKYNKRNVAHLKLGLDAVIEYGDVPSFNDGVMGANATTQSPAPTDMVLSKSSLKATNIKGE